MCRHIPAVATCCRQISTHITHKDNVLWIEWLACHRRKVAQVSSELLVTLSCTKAAQSWHDKTLYLLWNNLSEELSICLVDNCPDFVPTIWLLSFFNSFRFCPNLTFLVPILSLSPNMTFVAPIFSWHDISSGWMGIISDSSEARLYVGLMLQHLFWLYADGTAHLVICYHLLSSCSSLL